MPRKTHPNRRNTRRTTAKGVTTNDTRTLTTEALAESLVERRLASHLILDGRRYPIHSSREGAPHAS